MKPRRTVTMVVTPRYRTKMDLVVTIGAITDQAADGRVKPKAAIDQIRKLCYEWMNRWIVRDRKRNPDPVKRRRVAAGRN